MQMSNTNYSALSHIINEQNCCITLFLQILVLMNIGVYLFPLTDYTEIARWKFGMMRGMLHKSPKITHFWQRRVVVL